MLIRDLVNYVEIGATYYFNKNFSTYVDYKINLLDKDDDFYDNNGIATDDVVGVGLSLPVLISQRAAACYCKTLTLA
ncbi:porin [Escherichia coli]|nr:porin [Escherichia coli]